MSAYAKAAADAICVIDACATSDAPARPIDVTLRSNVVAYPFNGDPVKANRSEDLPRGGGVISVQVLNELTLVARRKLLKTWPEVRRILAEDPIQYAVAPLTIDVHERVIAYAERSGPNVLDALLISAAVRAQRTALLSEDMHNGLVIDGLTIPNPYLPAP